MLTIRDKQMDALRLSQRSRLEERISMHLRAGSPEGCRSMDDSALREFARRAIDIAVKHGVDTQGSVVDLAGLLFDFGEELERSPADVEALEILRDPTLPGQIKVILLRECLTADSGGRAVVTGD